jgi:hypothetical protein
MPAKPTNALELNAPELNASELNEPAAFDSSVLARLACPACHGDLHLDDLHLICGACARRYPIVDGIPALIVERVETTAT